MESGAKGVGRAAAQDPARVGDAVAKVSSGFSG